jgi:hypothetical protein
MPALRSIGGRIAVALLSGSPTARTNGTATTTTSHVCPELRNDSQWHNVVHTHALSSLAVSVFGSLVRSLW